MTPMVTDAEAARWCATDSFAAIPTPTGSADADLAVAMAKRASRLLADRKRMLALIAEQDAALRLTIAEIHQGAGLLPRDYNYEPTVEAANVSQRVIEAYSKLLKEAGRGD